ncbi:right-handed parallel beta-helix repeat-containing protein [Pseudomonas sp. FYR_11]|uniref:right-handed parallel beta-helix repeat-containing protein n=1 Tax=Pseudomonas TaxID=286 RepID=UPI00370C98DC
MKLLLAILLTYALAPSATAAERPFAANQLCTLPILDNYQSEVLLDSNCTYSGTFQISKSDFTLDCRGAKFDGMHKFNSGIVVTGKGRQISNITIKNCALNNYKRNSIEIKSGIAPDKLNHDASKLYAIAPNKITLNNLVITNSGSGAVYFYAYVHNSSLTNSHIESSKEAGIYLSQNTKNIEIAYNTITQNGHNSKKANRREGLAIDTSSHNSIHNNSFIANGAGGIFLYTKCGKFYTTSSWSPSNYNVIKENTFSNEPVGVWLASRQSRDLSSWNCTAEPLDDQGKFFRDYADFNKVTGNKFCGGTLGVRIEGDNNQVTNNFYDPAQEFTLEPFSRLNKPDGSPTRGNRLENNRPSVCN